MMNTGLDCGDLALIFKDTAEWISSKLSGGGEGGGG